MEPGRAAKHRNVVLKAMAKIHSIAMKRPKRWKRLKRLSTRTGSTKALHDSIR
ncbi:hypothetical protein PO124_01125 [Bacillus licheniformis]|nr:hypothetical protein [Bacillus licheniformis]